MNKIEYLEQIGCKNPIKTLKFIEDPRNDPLSKGMRCFHKTVWEHIISFIDGTGEEGDDAIFFALNSCDNFSLFLSLLEETDNGFVLYDEEGEINFECIRNKQGYLVSK